MKVELTQEEVESARDEWMEEHMRHIDNVMETRRRLGGISNSELLQMDYQTELKITKK